MDVSTKCFLNPFVQPIPAIAPVPCSLKNPRSRKRQYCLLGLTCLIVGLESNIVIVGGQHDALAQNLRSDSGDKITRLERWSDKRTCQPWHVNSLETIVPENLPRPSARHRWKFIDSTESAPAVKISSGNSTKSCFLL